MKVQRAVYLLFVMMLSVMFNRPGLAQQTVPPQSVRSETPEQHEAWRKALKSIARPKKGCFKTTYPSTEWQEVPCGVAPNHPYAPSAAIRAAAKKAIAMKLQGIESQDGKPDTVGNGYDFVGNVGSGLLSSADGSFPIVVGLENYSDYSIQVNANVFSNTPACNGATNPAGCLGWEQFVYSEPTSQLFIESWLLSYGNPCPTGWTAYESDCYINSAATSVPAQNLGDLPYLTMTGQAVLGGNDSAMLDTANSGMFSADVADTIVSLASYWMGAEFNIFGDGNGDQVSFNSGTTFTVQTLLNNGTQNVPYCSTNGTTSETNNLTLAPSSQPVCCPYGGSSPSIQFMESNASGASASCGVSGLQTNIAASPTTSNGKETQITHPVEQGVVRTQYSATLLDSTPGATIYYTLFDGCGNEVDSGSGSSGLMVSFIGVQEVGQSCPYEQGITGPVSGTMYAAAPGYVQSGTRQIAF